MHELETENYQIDFFQKPVNYLSNKPIQASVAETVKMSQLFLWCRHTALYIFPKYYEFIFYI